MIEELQRFILAVQEGNLTKTAEKIFITQSALTQSIQRLEKALGTKVFIQKGKTLQLTSDGKAIYAIGSKISELWERAKYPEVQKILHPVYTIGAFDNAALQLGNYFQKNINSQYFDLELSISTSSNLLFQLQLGILDMAICVIDKKHTPPKNITLIKTFKEELIPVSFKKFSGSIHDIPFILYNKGAKTREQIDTTFFEHGIKPKIFAESTSTTFMKELALLGCGVTLLPQNYIRAELAQKSLIKQRLPLKWYREYGIYIQEKSKLSQEQNILKEIIKNLRKKK
jgi:DNA-binding transcriptional LysR family regulator